MILPPEREPVTLLMDDMVDGWEGKTTCYKRADSKKGKMHADHPTRKAGRKTKQRESMRPTCLYRESLWRHECIWNLGHRAPRDGELESCTATGRREIEWCSWKAACAWKKPTLYGCPDELTAGLDCWHPESIVQDKISGCLLRGP